MIDALALGFVIVGIAMIVSGATRPKPDMVIVGILVLAAGIAAGLLAGG